MACRKGERASAEVVSLRKAVVVNEQDGFWFKTREGVDFGPYLSREQAMLGRRVFVYQVTGDLRYKPQLPEHQQYLLEVEETRVESPESTR